eukprot:scaffold4665_cov162-Skeletonema_marinoi.AAC.1
MGRGGGRGNNMMGHPGGRGRGMMGGPPGRGGGRGGGPPPGMSHYGPSSSQHHHQGGRGMMIGRGDNHYNNHHAGRMDGRGHMMGRGPPLPHGGRGNMMDRGGDMRRGPGPRDPRGRGPMNNDFGRYGPGGGHPNNRFPMNNRGPPPPPPPPPPPNRMNGNMNHQMHSGRGHPQQNMMRMHPNQPQMNMQQQQPFPPGGHLQQPFNGQQQHQQMQMNQSPLQMQHQMQMPGMPPLNQQHPPMQQQQLFSPNGQTQPVGQFPPHQQMQMMNQQGPPPQVISPQHTQQIVAAASPATAAAAAAPTADGWTEHRSPQGIPYYFNTITNVSTYERPASLSQPLQNGAAAGSATSSPTKASGTSAPATSWQTYTDQNTGKKYYSNGATVTWTRPPELGPDESADNSASNKRSSASENESAKKKRKKGEKDDGCLYANKAEAVAAFKGLLLAKDIAPTTKWNDVVRICAEDARWEACNTIGERKQALAEYQTKRANELRDVKRQEKVRAKEAYQRLLTDILPTVKTFSPGSSRFMDVRDFLSKDDRFYAVDDETTREELFYEFVEEMRKREERNKRSKKREAKDAYLAFLKLREEDGKFTFASTWASFISSLGDEEKNDSRFIVSANMSESDRQLYFSDYVIELQNAEDEKRRRIRDARRRAEKAQRDAYREKLREFAKLGTVIPSTHWRSVEDKIASDPCYEPVLAQGRDVPMEIFNDFVDDWNEQYRRDRSTLSRLWESSKKEIKLDESTGVDFSKKLLDYSANSPDIYADIRRMSSNEPLSSIMLFFNELKANAGVQSANRRSSLLNDEDSSEDEGEIKEDGEEAE